MSTHKARVAPRSNTPRRNGDVVYWSDMQVSCEVDGWKSSATSYAQQVADYQQHKNG